MIGTFTSNVDMKSGAPAFGTPEYMRATQMTGQMARFYGLPLRASNACAANAPDGQAMWESLNSLWSAVQSGANLVYHAAGWLEGGLIASYEKFVMDCEVLQQIQRYFEPRSDDTGAGRARASRRSREVGPHGHFFGAEHTQSRYATAFYAPFLSDWRNYEAWEEAGAVDAPSSGPTGSGRRSSPSSSRRRWTRASARSWPTSSRGGSARAARRPTIEAARACGADLHGVRAGCLRREYLGQEDGKGGERRVSGVSIVDDGPFAPCPAPFNMAAHTFAPARRRPEKVALEVLAAPGMVAERWTHGALAEAVRRTAGGLAALGVGAGRPGAAPARQHRATSRCCSSRANALGAVPVPVSALLTAAEVGAIIADLGPGMIASGPGSTLPGRRARR